MWLGGDGCTRRCGTGGAMDVEGFTEELPHELRLCLKAVYWAEEGESIPGSERARWISAVAETWPREMSSGGRRGWKGIPRSAVLRNLDFCLEVLGPHGMFKLWCHGPICALSSSLWWQQGEGPKTLKARDLSVSVQPTGFEGLNWGRGRGNMKEKMDLSNI